MSTCLLAQCEHLLTVSRVRAWITALGFCDCCHSLFTPCLRLVKASHFVTFGTLKPLNHAGLGRVLLTIYSSRKSASGQGSASSWPGQSQPEEPRFFSARAAGFSETKRQIRMAVNSQKARLCVPAKYAYRQTVPWPFFAASALRG